MFAVRLLTLSPTRRDFVREGLGFYIERLNHFCNFHLVEVREGVLVFHLEWPVPKGEAPSDYRYKFIEALLARATGLGIQVVSVRSRAHRES